MAAIVQAEEVVRANDAGAVHSHQRNIGSLSQRKSEREATAGEVVDQMAMRAELGMPCQKSAGAILELHQVRRQVYFRRAFSLGGKTQGFVAKARPDDVVLALHRHLAALHIGFQTALYCPSVNCGRAGRFASGE